MLLIFLRVLVILTICKANNGFVLQRAHIDNLGGNVNDDFSVVLDISDEDYEMISDDDLIKLNIHLDEFSFKEFNSVVNKEYENDMKSRCGKTEVKGNKSKSKITGVKADDNDGAEVITTLSPVGAKVKREILKTGLKQSEFLSKTETQTESTAITNIYYAVKTGKFESGFRVLDSIKEIISIDISTNCTIDDSRGIGLRAIKCLVEDYLEKRQSYNKLAIRLWNIAVIWLLVFLTVAIPLWCTRGWCCCCLCCKFFKPQETIQEAKKYLLLNPPGTLVTKRGGIIHYEPTEREKDCYEEFGHFIRTL